MAAFAPKDPAKALEYFRAKMSFTTGPVELSKAIEAGSVRVVDVRTSEAFAREHIPGSIHLPESEWANASERGLSSDKTNVLTPTCRRLLSAGVGGSVRDLKQQLERVVRLQQDGAEHGRSRRRPRGGLAA